MSSFVAPISIRPIYNRSTGKCWRPRQTITCQQQGSSRLIALPTGINMEVMELPAKISQDRDLPSKERFFPYLEKPPIIFVHGSLHAAWCFRFFGPYFAQNGFQTFAISLRGAGNTENDNQGAPTFEQHAADLAAFVKEIAVPVPPVIIAHSLGGFIIQKWLEADPSIQLSALVLMASSPPSGNSKITWRTLTRKGILEALRITLAIVRRTVATDVKVCRKIFFSSEDQEGFSSELESDEVLQEYMKYFKESKLILDLADIRKVVRKARDLPGKILVIGGLQDALVDKEALEETAEFWKADLRLVEGAPHDLMLFSSWESVASMILEWMTTALALSPAEMVMKE